MQLEKRMYYKAVLLCLYSMVLWELGLVVMFNVFLFSNAFFLRLPCCENLENSFKIPLFSHLFLQQPLPTFNKNMHTREFFLTFPKASYWQNNEGWHLGCKLNFGKVRKSDRNSYNNMVENKTGNCPFYQKPVSYSRCSKITLKPFTTKLNFHKMGGKPSIFSSLSR